jgi:hypothetical protein
VHTVAGRVLQAAELVQLVHHALPVEVLERLAGQLLQEHLCACVRARTCVCAHVRVGVCVQVCVHVRVRSSAHACLPGCVRARARPPL